VSLAIEPPRTKIIDNIPQMDVVTDIDDANDRAAAEAIIYVAASALVLLVLIIVAIVLMKRNSESGEKSMVVADPVFDEIQVIGDSGDERTDGFGFGSYMNVADAAESAIANGKCSNGESSDETDLYGYGLIDNDVAAVAATSDTLCDTSAIVASADYARFDGKRSDKTDLDGYGFIDIDVAAVAASSVALGDKSADYARFDGKSSDETDPFYLMPCLPNDAAAVVAGSDALGDCRTNADVATLKCDDCYNEANPADATHWCPNCEAYFCEGCVKPHHTLKSLKKHPLLTVEEHKAVTDGAHGSTGSLSADYKRFDVKSSDETDPDFYLIPNDAAAVVTGSDALGDTRVHVASAEYARFDRKSSDETDPDFYLIPNDASAVVASSASSNEKTCTAMD
jgi:hypothetical protein